MDIRSIAKEVIIQYAEGLKYLKGVEFVNRVLYISLDKEFNATPSMSSTILTEAYQAVLILVRDEVAITNSYWWFELRYITHDGIVFNSFNINEWSIDTFCDGKYIDQKIGIKYNNQRLISKDLLTDKWINNVKEIFDYFSVLRNASTEAERNWMLKYLLSDSTKEGMQSKNQILEKKVSFLENQLKKYTDLLDRLERIIEKSNPL